MRADVTTQRDPQVRVHFYYCNKYISVFAPGTLGILPDFYLVPVSHGLGDIISIYQYMDIKYHNNLQYMGLWGFINVTERNHRMTLNTAFIHINTSINSIHHITAHGR